MQAGNGISPGETLTFVVSIDGDNETDIAITQEVGQSDGRHVFRVEHNQRWAISNDDYCHQRHTIS